MRPVSYLSGLVFLLSILTACHYPTRFSPSSKNTIDSLQVLHEHPYALNSNFKVTADTLWLYRLPFTDSIFVGEGDELVVAEFSVYPKDSIDSVWVKVARDQETIGWLREKQLLENIVPVDPISQCIRFFTNSRMTVFTGALVIFLLGVIHYIARKKHIRQIWMNGIDSFFPVTLSWLFAASAVIYNSIQHFTPEIWERYYYSPSLNPFDLPPMLGLFILCAWLIVLLGMALLDDFFHQATTIEAGVFYLMELTSCCIMLYTLLACLWIYAAYVCFAAYSVWCILRLRKANRYPYACGACGAKMRSKGICPHCGAFNE